MGLFSRKKKVEAEVEEVKAPAKTETKKATTKKTTKTTKAKVEVAKVEKTVEKTETAKTENAGKSKFSYRITEKATKMSDKNVFVLNVPKETNKTELKKELVKKYKVTVLGIRMVNIAKKAKVYRGRAGHRGGGRKAYVTVKAGESIVL
jgi:large subunit ribosomal protein L23